MNDIRLTLICLCLSSLSTLGLFLVTFYRLRKEEIVDRHGRRRKRC